MTTAISTILVQTMNTFLHFIRYGPFDNKNVFFGLSQNQCQLLGLCFLKFQHRLKIVSFNAYADFLYLISNVSFEIPLKVVNYKEDMSILL